MRITWSIHLYPPRHNCGSEWMAHNINRYLMSKGHQVRVILHQAAQNKINVPYNFEGVDVTGPTGKIEQFQWPDVLLTHLEYTAYTVPLAKICKRPVIHFVHNDTPYQSITNAIKCNVVYNSQWIADKLKYKWPSMVFQPFCDYAYMNVNPVTARNNDYVTLINLNENKGGEIFYEIARRMPHKKFLGVQGSYEEQILQSLPNVTILPNTNDIRTIYRQTRLLIMPSAYESWGMTATEAMCNGIPVISTTTPGLMENCGNAGCYVNDRNDIDQWVKWIERFDNDVFYEQASEVVRTRALQLCDEKRLAELENFIYAAKQNYR